MQDRLKNRQEGDTEVAASFRGWQMSQKLYVFFLRFRLPLMTSRLSLGPLMDYKIVLNCVCSFCIVIVQCSNVVNKFFKCFKALSGPRFLISTTQSCVSLSKARDRLGLFAFWMTRALLCRL